MKRFGIFACLAALLLGSAACAGPEGQSGSVSTAEGSTEDNTTAVADEPPVALEFSGGAVWSDGTPYTREEDAQAKEREESLYTKTTDNGDGTKTLEVYGTPVKYR